jgi:hypothetical protein
MDVPAGRAGARRLRAVETLEHRREIALDIGQREIFLVQLVVAALAEPQQAIALVRQAPAFDHQADGTGHALRRMRHARRQVEHLAGADRDVARDALVLHLEHHLAFQLMEELRAFVVVVVGARVRSTDDHHDEVAIDDALVAHRRLEQVAVLVDPALEVDGWCQGHGMGLVAADGCRSEQR